MFTFVFFIAVIVAIFVLIQIQPTGRRTLFEPGLMIIELFSLCYLLPALAIVSGANILPIEDQDYVEQVSLYGLLFVISFVLFYLSLKSFSRLRIFLARNMNVTLPPAKCLIGFSVLFMITKMIGGYYGVGDSAEYAQQYIVRASMPPVVNQVIVLFQSLQWMFVYLLLAASLSDPHRARSRRYILLIAVIFVSEMWLTNARNNFVTFCMVFMGAYIFFQRPIGLVKEAIIAVIFVVGIGLFAFKRLDPERLGAPNLLDILIPSEFTVIYRNAIYLVSMLDTTDFLTPPSSSYLQALIAFLPSQFNEGKWDLANWYVQEYFPSFAEAGGGLAFGIIPEAIVNWGLLSIIFQAFILAFIFRVTFLFAQENRAHALNVWVVFYIFCFSQLYQAIRFHSFTIISSIVMGFVVPFITLYLFSKIRWLTKHSVHD